MVDVSVLVCNSCHTVTCDCFALVYNLPFFPSLQSLECEANGRKGFTSESNGNSLSCLDLTSDHRNSPLMRAWQLLRHYRCLWG